MLLNYTAFGFTISPESFRLRLRRWFQLIIQNRRSRNKLPLVLVLSSIDIVNFLNELAAALTATDYTAHVKSELVLSIKEGWRITKKPPISRPDYSHLRLARYLRDDKIFNVHKIMRS